MEGNSRYLQLRHTSPPACALTTCCSGGSVVPSARVVSRSSLRRAEPRSTSYGTLIYIHDAGSVMPVGRGGHRAEPAPDDGFGSSCNVPGGPTSRARRACWRSCPSPLRPWLLATVGADVCLAFIRYGSHGASHTARLAAETGIPTHRYLASKSVTHQYSSSVVPDAG